jgi:hypothetical protein
MTEEIMKPSRRDALGALASLTALALPAVVVAAEPAQAHLDEPLFALIAAARDLDARGKEAFDDALEATRRTEKVPAPEALIVTEDDTRLWKLLNAGDLFDESHLDSMRGRLQPFSSMLADAPYVSTLNEKDRAILELLVASEARANQLIPAHDQWKAARHEAKVSSGELDAWNRSDELLDEKHKLWRRIMMTPAHTEAGMMAKLALVAPYFDAAELEDVEETADGILASVAVDFNALRDSHAIPEGFANV